MFRRISLGLFPPSPPTQPFLPHRRNLFCALALCGLLSITRAWSQPAASPMQWQSPATGTALAMNVLEPEGLHRDKPLPLVIYLKNLGARRVGAESDEAIIHDLLAAGQLILTLDYAGHVRARVPFINRDLGKLRDDLRAGQLLPQYKLDNAHVFIVPEGSRLLRDVVYCRETGRTLEMDVVYPSHPARPVGAILEFSCDNKDRMGNTSLSICSDTVLDAEATEGFAVAMADHPVAAPYQGLDAMPDCAWRIKAAVRTLRAEGARLGLNGKIAPVGFSRGSGMALMLATTEGMSEFEGHGEHTNTSSSVQGAVIMSGRFTYLDLLAGDHMLPRYAKAWGQRDSSLDVWRRQGALDYLDHATTPLFLTINCGEAPDALHQMTVLRRRLAELGNDEIFLMEREPRGHKVPLASDILDAMDRYLKGRLN
jgi:dienelactone hydrolase